MFWAFWDMQGVLVTERCGAVQTGEDMFVSGVLFQEIKIQMAFSSKAQNTPPSFEISRHRARI